ncbi:hypothetical protein EAO68_22010 [Streptomyces sp. wa22]|nr:hypothetical protein EAO68_22010 [Streptomyces sp. wa22]
MGMCQSPRMLEIVVKTENRERHARVSAEELAGLVRRIGGDGDRCRLTGFRPVACVRRLRRCIAGPR